MSFTGRKAIIFGRRPVREALQSRISIDRIIIRIGSGGRIIDEILSAARRGNIRIDRIPAEIFDRKYPLKSAGVVAVISPIRLLSLEELLVGGMREDKAPILVILDGIMDTHNLGAIARTVEAAGCSGIIIPQRRAAHIDSTTVKVSAGALLHLPIARVKNISSAIKDLKNLGFWIYGADMEGKDYRKIEYQFPAVVVIGAEGKGISQLVRKNCDELVAIPLSGNTNSLNASVAAGIIIFHLVDRL